MEDVYYNNENEWGNYQYVTVEEVVTDFIMSRSEDDFTINEPRYKILYHCKKTLKELYYDVLREIKILSIDLSPKLTVTLPPDYVNMVRMSWINDDGELVEISRNNNSIIGHSYLQDHEYNVLFDHNGCPLIDNNNITGKQENNTTGNNKTEQHYCYSFHGGFRPNKDLSKTYRNGYFNLDKNSGIIRFSSNIEGKAILLEYVSDGFYEGCEGEDEPKVHKFALNTLLDGIYYNLIKQRRNVPQNEKYRARKEYYNNKRISKRRINSLNKSDILQAMKGVSKWIKA